VFDEPAVNTFDVELADELAANSTYRLLDRREIKVRRLADILRKRCP